jgi:hypothetical protein
MMMILKMTLKLEKKQRMIWTEGIGGEWKMLMILINLWMKIKESMKHV